MNIDKELLKFVEGQNNFYRAELSISREPTAEGKSAFYTIKSGDIVIMTFWHSFEDIKLKEDKPKSEKHTTGGKKPYAMLMESKVVEMRESGNVPFDEAGMLMYLTPNIEWETGRIIDKRTKKPLKAKDIEKTLNVTHNVFRRLSKGLKDKGLIEIKKDGYFVSRDLFKKGKIK